MQHAVVPISASASVSSDVREVREQVEHPPEYTWLTCSDVPNFADDGKLRTDLQYMYVYVYVQMNAIL